jgi:hypothetical protein
MKIAPPTYTSREDGKAPFLLNASKGSVTRLKNRDCMNVQEGTDGFPQFLDGGLHKRFRADSSRGLRIAIAWRCSKVAMVSMKGKDYKRRRERERGD